MKFVKAVNPLETVDPLEAVDSLKAVVCLEAVGSLLDANLMSFFTMYIIPTLNSIQ